MSLAEASSVTRGQPIPNRIRLHSPPRVLVFPRIDESAKRRARPIHRRADVAVFDRVEVDVVHVPLQIAIITNLVLDEPTLPDRAFPLPLTRGGHRRQGDTCREDRSGESRLDKSPSRRVVVVSRRQLPHAMQMVRQEHHGNRFERAFSTRLFQRPAQQWSGAFRRKHPAPTVGDQREGDDAAGLSPASIP